MPTAPCGVTLNMERGLSVALRPGSLQTPLSPPTSSPTSFPPLWFRGAEGRPTHLHEAQLGFHQPLTQKLLGGSHCLWLCCWTGSWAGTSVTVTGVLSKCSLPRPGLGFPESGGWGCCGAGARELLKSLFPGIPFVAVAKGFFSEILLLVI